MADEKAAESLLPYDDWTEAALRQVMVRALAFAATNGLPGEHHFYITFRTTYPGVQIPPRLLAQYPDEMTIVLQHQFWDLAIDDAARQFRVGLSFGGIPAALVIPLDAVVQFADPHVRLGLRFRPVEPPETVPAAAPGPLTLVPEAQDEPPPADEGKPETPQVVSLDAFRRRPPPPKT